MMTAFMPGNRRGCRILLTDSLQGLLFPLLLTACGWLFRYLLEPNNILLIYLLGVFFIALKLGLWPSILAALTSAGAFAYFFAPPIFSFAIAEPKNILALIVMLVIGAITSQLAATVRRQSRISEYREQCASALYRLGRALAEADSQAEIIEAGLCRLQRQFGGAHAFLLAGQAGNGSPSVPDIDFRMVDQVLQSGRPAGHGVDSQTPALYLPMQGVLGIVGVAVLVPAHAQPVTESEHRQFLTDFVNQIARALEKNVWLEQSRETALKIQSETLRNSLLSSISHDLRTPLATILGAATALETDADRLSVENRRTLVQTISHEARRMSDLTIKILEMARLEAGEVVLHRQCYDVEEIIGSALHRLDNLLKSRTIGIRMPEQPALVHVDAVLLQTVLVNLLDNAHKYSPLDQPIDIDVRPNGGDMIISVRDHGQGIAAAFAQQIFDKFFQMQPEGAQSGMGLGLSICRAIVRAHGGEIETGNHPAGGAIFTVRLPIADIPLPQGDDLEKC